MVGKGNLFIICHVCEQGPLVVDWSHPINDGCDMGKPGRPVARMLPFPLKWYLFICICMLSNCYIGRSWAKDRSSCSTWVLNHWPAIKQCSNSSIITNEPLQPLSFHKWWSPVLFSGFFPLGSFSFSEFHSHRLIGFTHPVNRDLHCYIMLLCLSFLLCWIFYGGSSPVVHPWWDQSCVLGSTSSSGRTGDPYQQHVKWSNL